MPSNGNITTFIDTQVLYNREYTYEITAFVVFYGVKYSYELQSMDYISGKAIYNVTSEPDPMILEVKLFSSGVTVSPNPPMPPSVRFMNSSNSESSLKVALQLTGGKIEDHFISVLASDEDLKMKIDTVTKKTLFKHNKERIIIEMFKVKEKPKSILDFRSALVRTVSRDNFTGTDRDAQYNMESLILKDNVFPNTKYYYMFRTKSESGMISNPSPVFEVELIKDSDSTSLLIGTIQLDKRPETDTSKKFRNLFQVRPSLAQSVLQTTPNRRGTTQPFPLPIVAKEIFDDFSLGEAEESIWGRKFKLRVKSNDSGKIVDINIKFDFIKDKKIEDL